MFGWAEPHATPFSLKGTDMISLNDFVGRWDVTEQSTFPPDSPVEPIGVETADLVGEEFVFLRHQELGLRILGRNPKTGIYIMWELPNCPPNAPDMAEVVRWYVENGSSNVYTRAGRFDPERNALFLPSTARHFGENVPGLKIGFTDANTRVHESRIGLPYGGPLTFRTLTFKRVA